MTGELDVGVTGLLCDEVTTTTDKGSFHNTDEFFASIIVISSGSCSFGWAAELLKTEFLLTFKTEFLLTSILLFSILIFVFSLIISALVFFPDLLFWPLL